MNNFFIGILIIVSLILAFIDFIASITYDFGEDKKIIKKNAPWQFKFFEIWSRFFNFFIAGLIGYYFISVRWSQLLNGKEINVNDFILFFIFAACIFRWLPYLIKNFTEGINAILKRILDK